MMLDVACIKVDRCERTAVSVEQGASGKTDFVKRAPAQSPVSSPPCQLP